MKHTTTRIRILCCTLVLLLASACTTRTHNQLPDAGAGIGDGASLAPDAPSDPCAPSGDATGERPIDEDRCEDPIGMPPPLPRDCAPGTEWIYLIGYDLDAPEPGDIVDGGTVTTNARLLRYEPDSGTITVIGAPDCPAGISPFSMAVDRAGTAWVLSSRGVSGLFRISTADASCEPTAYLPNQGGYEEFGMGFAADARDATTEQLYVIGGPRAVIHGSEVETLFGVLDLGSLTITTRARTRGMGELTGTGEGNLWAFLGLAEGDVVTRLDPASGAHNESYPAAVSEPGWARAVAFWGGDFYVFVSSHRYIASSIFRVSTRTGRVREVGTVDRHLIVGAGVSTCAPYLLI
jgi:hypothetical protein